MIGQQRGRLPASHSAMSSSGSRSTSRLARILVEAIKGHSVSLEKVDTTMELLRADAVVGVKGFFDEGKKRLTGIGHHLRVLPFDRGRLVLEGDRLASMAGRTAISTSERSSRSRPTCSPCRIPCASIAPRS
jgi:hypothetical protein